MFEDAAQVNNVARADIPITYREPDLVVSQLDLPAGDLRSGQTVSLHFTVTNQGTHDTRQDQWVDRLYLSRDPSLDSHDLQVAELLHQGQLAAGASYESTAVVTLPADADGLFYLIAFADSNIVGVRGAGAASPVEVGQVSLLADKVPEFRDEGNNTTTLPLSVTLSPAADLRVTSVSVPERVEVGQLLHVDYTVANLGGAGTGASLWTDNIYLSADQFLDPVADRFVGQVTHNGALAAGGSYSVGTDVRLPGDLVGPYYVFVSTDVPAGATAPRGSVFEASAENNNVTVSADPVLIEQPPPSDLVVTNTR